MGVLLIACPRCGKDWGATIRLDTTDESGKLVYGTITLKTPCRHLSETEGILGYSPEAQEESDKYHPPAEKPVVKKSQRANVLRP